MRVSNLEIPVKIDESILPKSFPYKASDMKVRDPFILLCDGWYFLYKNDYKNNLVCLVSKDLENWSDNVKIFNPPADFYGEKDFFWAPECHYYEGWFYVITSCYSRFTKTRRISTYKAKTPLGPFEEVTAGGITPAGWDAIDGTVYIENGTPYMVFVHEWTSMPDKIGSFVYAELSKDFSSLIGEPKHMFYANELKTARSGVTDGCYLIRLDSGRLLMIWSNFTNKDYVIAKAYSTNGSITGEWVQDGLLYEKDLRADFTCDGGHGMVFKNKDDKFCVTYHAPNGSYRTDEKLAIRELVESSDTIKIL